MGRSRIGVSREHAPVGRRDGHAAGSAGVRREREGGIQSVARAHFYTSGEAVRRVAPAGYVPYAESAGVWQRGLQALRSAIEEIWLPYLNGRGTRDEALSVLVRRTLVVAKP